MDRETLANKDALTSEILLIKPSTEFDNVSVYQTVISWTKIVVDTVDRGVLDPSLQREREREIIRVILINAFLSVTKVRADLTPQNQHVLSMRGSEGSWVWFRYQWSNDNDFSLIETWK